MLIDPCYSCKSTDVATTEDRDQTAIFCAMCGTVGPYLGTFDQACAAWNAIGAAASTAPAVPPAEGVRFTGNLGPTSFDYVKVRSVITGQVFGGKLLWREDGNAAVDLGGLIVAGPEVGFLPAGSPGSVQP